MAEAAPLVSAVLLSYNCERFIAEALRSVLAQDYQPMELLVSDDASQDGTFEVLQRELADYRGPHRFRLQRRSTNSGSKSAHLNDLFPCCSGEILVSFDGDDVSDPRRVRKIVEVFRSDPRVRAVYSRYSLIDPDGRPLATAVPHPASRENTRTWFARVDAYAWGATLAVRRDVVEKFPPLDPAIAEDIVLPFRASLLGEVAFLDESLGRARRHAGSLTTDLERFESLERYRSRLQLGIERAARNLESRRADLRVAQSLAPERAMELGQLEVVAVDSLAQAQLTANLLSPALGVRVRILLRLMRAGAYREHLGRHAMLALTPRLYLRYKRWALRASSRRLAGASS